MTRMKLWWPTLAMLLLAFLCTGATSALGQATNTGTVVGVITDQNGAVIPEANITLTDTSTGAARTTATNADGHYVFVNTPPGSYQISVEKDGFSTAKTTQTVSVGTQTTANFKLAVGAAAQTVIVQTTGAELQTLNSTVGSTVPPAAINSLPSLGRDVDTFATLQPGVSPDGSVAGTVVDQATFQLDGGNNSNDMDGSGNVYTNSYAGDPTGGVSGASSSGVMPTPADSVEEFKVNTTNQTADFNNSSGMQVEVVTRRGTNQWRGTVYEYYLTNSFSGNTWSNNLTDTPRPSFHYNRFGAAGGGPILPKEIWGGKTYLFANYEGYRYPNSATYERSVPSANMRNGIVAFNGTTYDLKSLDPRGIGINPLVQQLWNTYEPVGNDPGCTGISGARCDGVNEVGYKANVSLPQNSNFFVARIDHDFGQKWHWMSSYRYYKLENASTAQVDIGGFFSGNKLGTPASLAQRPVQPWYFVTQLTTNITTNTTNDFHYNFLRNFWSWSTKNAPAQFSGLGGALEPMGESGTGVLAPFNVDTQDIRQRFWDGQDHTLRDDITMLKGNHLLNFGGQYQHNFNYHTRTDNGGGINYTTTYQLGDGNGAGLVDLSSLSGYPTSTTATRVAAATMGIVTDSQVAYTRSGNNLQLNAPLTPAADKVTIPYYNVYFSDTWHMKPSFTLTYGLGWALEMPPTEATGKQVELVDASDQPIDIQAYLARRKASALIGQVFNPIVGYALVGNTGKGLKYPYNPFYGSFSPRVAAAWNPTFDTSTWLGKAFGGNSTVLRGGYGRIYGRLNGVDQVLVPLLGTGLIQPVQCTRALSSGACGPDTPTAATAFRIGVDGNTAPLPAASATLPQPLYPGINDVSAAAGEALDPNFRPNVVDSIDFTIQRQLGPKMMVEVGYIGRWIHHEYQPININAVPYMMSAGGQQFQSAYAAIEKALGCTQSAAGCGANVPAATINKQPNPAYGNFINALAAQPFFESALAGTGYCNGTFSNGSGAYANCTAAAVDKELGNFEAQKVWSMWTDMDNGGFNFGRSMLNTPIPGSSIGSNGQISGGVGVNASLGYGNYNGGFISFSTHDWHGLTTTHNFTYSKALGTGAFVQATSEYTANDPFDLGKMYGLQGFQRKFVYNSFLVWEEPWFKGQQGLVGRLAGGWIFSPIMTVGSGAPLYCNTQTNAQSFGSADGVNFATNEQCVFTSPYKGGNSAHYGVAGGTDSFGNDVGTSTAGSGSAAVNMFKDPVAVFNQVRAPILGVDTKNPGVGPIYGMPYWNVDMSLQKNLRIAERLAFEYSMIFTNIFNHNVLHDPSFDISNPSSFGVISTQWNTPRKIQFGFRFRY